MYKAPRIRSTPFNRQSVASVELFIAVLGLTLAASTLTLSLTWRLFYSFTTVEWVEKALVPLAFLAAVLLTGVFVRFKDIIKPRFLRVLTLLSLIVILVEITTQGQPKPAGFDYRPFGLTAVIVAFVIGFLLLVLLRRLMKWPESRTSVFWVSNLLLGAVLVVILARLLGLLGWNFEHADAVPIFEEFYAVGAGRDPYVDFAPLYQSLFSYPYRLFVFAGFDPVLSALWYIVILQVTCFVLVGFLLFKLVAKRLLWIAALVFAAIAFTSPFDELSLGDFWSNLPLRYFWPLLTAVLLYLGVNNTSSRKRAVLLGLSIASATAASITNFEFGVPVLAAAIFVIILFQLRRSTPGVWLLLAGAPVGLWAFYLGLLALRGRVFDPDLYYGYAIGYQAIEWMAINMPTRGFHLIYLCVPAAMFAWSFFLWTQRFDFDEVSLVLMFFSLLGLASFVYFAGRSALTGTISLNFFLAVMLAIWVPAVLGSLTEAWPGLSVYDRTSLSFLPSLALGISVLAFIFTVPYRDIEAPNRESFQRWYWIGQPEDVARAIASSTARLNVDPNRVAVIIPNSSFAAELAGVSNTMLTPQPFHLSEIPAMAQKQCELWKDSGIRFVLGEEPPPCANPRRMSIDGDLAAYAVNFEG